MKIALYGISGLYNYGCEAIVRGTTEIIHKTYPNAEITYICPSPKMDAPRLLGCDVKIVSEYPNKAVWFVKKGLTKLERVIDTKIGLYKRFLYKCQYSWIKNYDIVLSIGGDIYTIDRDDYSTGGPFYFNLFDMAEVAKEKKVPVVIWGASIGPFETSKYKKKVFFKHFEKCISYIYAREKNTEMYLKDNGFEKCSLFADPAFAVKTLKAKQPDSFTIGINLSPLSNRASFGKENLKTIITRQAKVIKNISETFNAKIVLLPHVVNSSITGDDDFGYLNSIYEYLKKDNIPVELLSTESNFLKIKNTLVDCNVVLAARMHCAINALTCGVPAVFLSYSDKSVGMSKLVYGSTHYAISMEQFNDGTTIKSLLEEIIFDYEVIKNTVHRRYFELKESAFKSAEIISLVKDEYEKKR